MNAGTAPPASHDDAPGVSAAPCDVVVLGAGAAGLVAGLRAAERGRRTLVLEKNKQPGVKILMSGGTRCNLTHDTDARGIVAAYGPPGKFLHSALAALSIADTLALFHAEGVDTKVEETGKIFPVSNKAADVLHALVQRLHRSGAVLALNEPVVDLLPGFEVVTPRRRVQAARVIVTTGGRSYPGSGTTGDGYRIAEAFGHRIVPPVPALVPLTTGEAWVRELRGLTLPDASVRLMEAERQLDRRRGSLLFAHFGLTGPVILDISREVSRHSAPSALSLELDFVPACDPGALDAFLRDEALASGRKQLAVVLAQKIPRRLAEALLTRVGLPVDRKAAGLTRAERQQLVEAVKRQRISVAGTMGFGKAEVTAGGVALDEIDSRTLQSKRVPGLYFAGEVLDLDGPIGGYNFQAAWSTGWLAGSSV